MSGNRIQNSFCRYSRRIVLRQINLQSNRTFCDLESSQLRSLGIIAFGSPDRCIRLISVKAGIQFVGSRSYNVFYLTIIIALPRLNSHCLIGNLIQKTLICDHLSGIRFLYCNQAFGNKFIQLKRLPVINLLFGSPFCLVHHNGQFGGSHGFYFNGRSSGI